MLLIEKIRITQSFVSHALTGIKMFCADCVIHEFPGRQPRFTACYLAIYGRIFVDLGAAFVGGLWLSGAMWAMVGPTIEPRDSS